MTILRMILPAGTIAVTGCLGADWLTTDAGSFPRIELRSEDTFLNVPRGALDVVRVDIDKYHYGQHVRFTADSVPPGVLVTFAPALVDAAATAQRTALTIRVTDAAAPGEHRVVIRAGGVVVRSTTMTFILRVP